MNELQFLFKETSKASRKLSSLSNAKINSVLDSLMSLLRDKASEVLEANQKDLAKMDPADPKFDRLLLTLDRIDGIINEIQQVQRLSSPLKKTLEQRTLANGLYLQKISVPLGVIGIIYESRPNVTVDVFTLALKSGNALILKGGSDAHETNTVLINIIHQALVANELATEVIALLPPDREATRELLHAVKYVDVIIPRGSQQLIEYVRTNSKVPVIETGAGIVHTYFDVSANLEKGKNIIFNSKTRRPSVCNSLDCLIIHADRLSELAELVQPLLEANVEIFADELAYEALRNLKNKNIKIAKPEHFGSEFLSLKMSIKTVCSLDDAIEHIHQFSSKHSEAIVAEDSKTIQLFLEQIDAAAVYANASTAFTDGNQFGMGAEIGISTQKLHARGPMALEELTSYKWIAIGDGQVR